MSTTMPFPHQRGRARSKQPLGRAVRWLIVLAVLAALLGGFFWWRSSQTAATPTTTTATVSTGDIAVVVSGSGAVAAARTSDLAFEQSGTVTSVDVAVGESVTAGQTLAQIDTAELDLAVQQAQANLKTAEANLAEVQNGTTTESEVQSAQAQLASAEANLNETRTGSATAADIASAQAQLASAQAQLDALTNPDALDLNNAQLQLSQAQTNLENQRDSLSQAKSSAENQMEQAVNALTVAQNTYATAKHNWEYVQETGNDPVQPETTGSDGSSEDNDLTSGQAQQYADAFVQAEANLKDAENAVTQAQIAYDTARENEATQIPLLEQEVANAQAQLAALSNPSATDLAQAKASFEQAKANLASLQAGGTAAEVTQAQASVASAQASLEALTAPATDAAVATAAASVLQAQVDLATAQDNLAAATLAAPYDGVVTAVSLTEGASSTADSAAITIADTSTLHVDVSLSETDIEDIAVGQPVTLTFDALSDETLTGTVATVAPAATTDSDVVTYPVTVEFDPGDSGVKVGMSATADIQVDGATGALLVPTRTIQTTGERATVTVQRGEALMQVPVVTGLASDGQTEIVSSGGDGIEPLAAGDTIVTSSSSTTATSTQSSSSTNRSSTTPSGGVPGMMP